MPTAMPAWRNMSLTPDARPLCSGGAELSASWLTVGFRMPVPTIATSRPGRNRHHDVSASASVSSARPAATSARPVVTSARGDAFCPTEPIEPATRKLSSVPGT